MSSMMSHKSSFWMPTALLWDTDQVGGEMCQFFMNISEDQLHEDRMKNQWSPPLTHLTTHGREPSQYSAPIFSGWDSIQQGWPTSQRPRATFFTVLLQRATSYTWAHMNITPSHIPSTRTHIHTQTDSLFTLFSQIYCKCNTHQHDTDRNWLLQN